MNDLLYWMEVQDLDVALPIAGFAVLVVLIALSFSGTRRASGRRSRRHQNAGGAQTGIAAGSSKGSDKDAGADGDGGGD